MLLSAFLLNPVIKTSLHLAFATFCAVLLTSILPIYGTVFLSFLPLLAWSRLTLRRHVFSEVLAGFALGNSSAFCLLGWQHLAGAW